MKKAVYLFAFIAFSLLTACSSTKAVAPVSVLTGKTWQLASINGNAVDASAYREIPFVTFTTANKVTGKGGCNSFSGSYNLNNEGGINISQVASTKMACEGVNEHEFFTTLEQANMTKINADKVVLLNGVKEIMVFVPKN